MTETDINITFETLFEILRLEKNRIELQKIDDEFYTNVSLFIKEKEQVFSVDSNVSSSEKELQSKQLMNIKKIFQNIYFRRIRKIMNMAMDANVSSDSVIEKGALLAAEKEFFGEFDSMLKTHKNDIMEVVLKGEFESDQSIEKSKENSVGISVPAETSKSSEIKVKFVKEVPKFMGEDLEEYGPFAQDDITSVPKQLADILINKGSAVAVSE